MAINVWSGLIRPEHRRPIWIAPHPLRSHRVEGGTTASLLFSVGGKPTNPPSPGPRRQFLCSVERRFLSPGLTSQRNRPWRLSIVILREKAGDGCGPSRKLREASVIAATARVTLGQLGAETAGTAIPDTLQRYALAPLPRGATATKERADGGVPPWAAASARRLWTCRFAWTTQARCPHAHSRNNNSRQRSHAGSSCKEPQTAPPYLTRHRRWGHLTRASMKEIV
jgi:hypothetical protein